MAPPKSDTIALQRADSGYDLWAAIEAAQYARLVEHDEPRTAMEAERLRDLVGFFSDCAEGWEGKSAADQGVALEQLGIRLTELGNLGLRAYWAVAERPFETAEGEEIALPVAILAVLRADHSAVTVELPPAIGGA
jgi:hypothetical protein